MISSPKALTAADHTLEIGQLRVRPPLVMAPMAGITHAAFRRLLAELGGVGFFYSEMLSARALRHEVPGKSHVLPARKEGYPLCLQIFSEQTELIGPAVASGQSWGPAAWDLNLGCPAPEIVKQGAGSALLSDPDRARRLAVAMREAVPGPLLFKIRAQENRERFLDFAAMLQDAGADAIVLHARTASQKLGRPARWEYISDLVERLDIPVIGNGDIHAPEDALRMVSRTGCRGVMIGRGAVTRTWIFHRSARLFGVDSQDLGFRSKSEVFLRLVELLREEFSHPRDLYRLRKFTVYFSRNYKFGHQFWKEIHNSRDLKEAEERARAFFERQGEEDMIGE